MKKTTNTVSKDLPTNFIRPEPKKEFSDAWNGDHQLLSAFLSMLDPAAPLKPGGKRKRAKNSEMKILYHLFQLNKKVISGKWKVNFVSVATLCKGAEVCERSTRAFINSKRFERFGFKQRAAYLSNEYYLGHETVRMFSFFEKQGMMKGFREDYDAWKKCFLKRARKWLEPQLLKGYELEAVDLRSKVMNKLSTKSSVKMQGQKPAKIQDTRPSSSTNKTGVSTSYAYMRRNEMISLQPGVNPGVPEISVSPFQNILNAFDHVSKILTQEFRLDKFQTEKFLKTNSLNTLRMGIEKHKTFLNVSKVPRNKAAFFNFSLKKAKEEQKELNDKLRKKPPPPIERPYNPWEVEATKPQRDSGYYD